MRKIEIKKREFEARLARRLNTSEVLDLLILPEPRIEIILPDSKKKRKGDLFDLGI